MNESAYNDNDIDPEAASEAMAEMLSEVEASVLSLIQRTSAAPKDAYEAWLAFSHAIDWTETWIRGLLATHLILLIVVILLRKNSTAQCVIFLMICIVVRLAEPINSYCAIHWKEFATQNYFDKNGVFAGVLFAAPLLFIAFFQLINYLVLAAQALIIAKRLEIKIRAERKKARELKEATVSQSSTTESVITAIPQENSETSSSSATYDQVNNTQTSKPSDSTSSSARKRRTKR